MTQAAILAASATSGVSQSLKNRIINGAMVIDQRNAGASVTPTTDGQYTLDRWSAQLSSASKYSVQQNAGSVTPPAGFTNYLGVTSLAATTVGATDYYFVTQKVEGYNMADFNWGSANAKTVTLSFWVRSSLTGTFGAALINTAASDAWCPLGYTISSANTWEYKTITVAGPTIGAWNTTNGGGVGIRFSLGIGTTYSGGTSGTWTSTLYTQVSGSQSVVGTSSATFYITGVQLEVGTTATNFDYRQFTTELQLAQRYYCKTFNYSIAPAQNLSNYDGVIGFISQGNIIWDAMWRYPVEMRTTPSTITTYSPNTATANWSNNTDTPGASIVNAGSTGLTIRASSPTPGAASRSYTIQASASAEL
jgi:hypothetical protein